jgi:hypothetical protein
VAAADGPGQAIGAQVQRERPRLGRHRFGIAAGGRHALEVEVLGERMAGEPLGDRAGVLRTEPDQAEVVDGR